MSNCKNHPDYSANSKKQPECSSCNQLWLHKNANTLAEWNKRGFYVIRGSKAIGFNNDRKALFIAEQVYIPTQWSYEDEKDMDMFFDMENLY